MNHPAWLFRGIRRRIAAIAVMLATIGVTSCNRQPAESYTPGLGEIMTLTQMRHAKLWFAGQAGNWPLAAYELDELREGFDDAATFHPTHKDAPLPIAELIPKMTEAALKDLEQAVAARDRAKFAAAFDGLTTGCNGCHQATNFGFNVVARPVENPYTNQVFQPPQ